MKKNLRRFLLFVISYGVFGPAVISFAQDVSFSAPTNFAVGTNPRSAAVGDFNGDGKQDLAVANSNSNNVSILLGNGNGSFGSATNFAAGTTPSSVALGDFNGDGKQDLAVANAGSNNVSILLGDGNGTFGAATNFVIPSSPRSLAVADFNGDGKQDLVVAAFSGSGSIFFGNGDGSFGAATSFFVGFNFNLGPMAIGDFNGDGKQDLAVANWGLLTITCPKAPPSCMEIAKVSIFFGNGDGSFGAAMDFGVAGRDIFSSTGTVAVGGFAVGDFNGDGKQDLAVATGQKVAILLSNGTGSFGSPTNFTIGGSGSLAVGDFNGDGKQDLAVATGPPGNVSILVGNGSGSFGSPTNFTVGTGPRSLAVGDFNGDGKQDLAVSNESSNNVSILLNVPPVEKLSNISARGAVLTGDNVMIGGFIIAGSTSKRVLIRSRGPSMSGAPFFVPGTLTNPLLRLSSGSTVIAQNDNWQDAPSCSGFVCEDAAAITGTGLDPCTPNPGQSGPPPSCALEAAILITLPAGPYTAIVTGADGGTGVGLVEVFEADASTLSELSNISTRGFVQSGDNVMIGGVIIDGSAPKTVLIRARGPSMGGAPFFVPGTLANPMLQLFSGQNVIAFNDNWRDLQQEEILATGLDPCQPNPDQAVAPPGCDQESAVLLDLPAGGYTAIVSGVGGQTGVGLVEIFEVPDVIVPNALGTYVGSASVTFSSCQNPANNGLNNFSSTVNIGSQNGSVLSGTGTLSGPTTVNLNLSGTATAGGDVMGSFTFTSPIGSGNGTFTGSLVGNSLTINLAGQVTSGETCTLNGSTSGVR